ncbi:MAG: lipopolysaccharide heptosyltransferase II [Terriglobia bacterium]
MTEPRKILVRATNWIGDAVMSVPALDALRAGFPESEIVVLAKPWVSDVYYRHPAVTRQIIYDSEKEHRGTRGFSRLIRRLRDERFDAAVLLQNAFHAAWLAWRAGIPVRIGYARDGRAPLLTTAVEALPPAAYGHQAYYYLHLLFRAGLIARPEPPQPLEETRLAVQPEEQAWAERYLGSLALQGPRFLIGLAPGAAYGPAKRWPAARFAELADRLIAALSADVLIFGSQAEKALAEDVAGEMKHTPSIVAGETALRQSMAMLAQCRLVVSNDSGLMHLSAALGLPVIAIFGSTNPYATGPLGPFTRVLHNPVACSPCGLRVCPIDLRCMEGLSVDAVYRAALECVKRLGIAYDRAPGGR